MSTIALTLAPCRNCGASLPVEPGLGELTCAFCGHRTPAPAAAALAPAAEAAEAEKESLEALEAVLIRHYSPKTSARIGMMFAVMFGSLGIMVVGIQLGFAVGTNVVGVLCMGIGMVLLIAGILFAFLAGGGRAKRMAQAQLQSVHAQVAHGPRKGRCPKCGGAVQVPGVAATMTCSYCQASLVAAEGMLIEWAHSTHERARRWQGQSQELLKSVQLAERVSGLLSPVVWIISSFVIVFGLGALTFVVRAVLGLD